MERGGISKTRVPILGTLTIIYNKYKSSDETKANFLVVNLNKNKKI